MIDLCPRCRIQAPHRVGRTECPRCGGPLSVLNSDLIGPPTGPIPRIGQPAAPSVARSQPRTSPSAGRRVRWVARRPPEAIPAPRPPRSDRRPAIPRYRYIPAWGLRDEPLDPHPAADATAMLRTLLMGTLHWLGIALAAQAVAHLLRYLIIVVNRSTPIPGWLDDLSSILVMFCGLVALGGFIYATVVFVRWLISLRHDTYRDRDLVDPRPWWLVVLLAGVPMVNIVGAPLLIGDVVALRTDQDLDRTRSRLTRIWVAWTLVNVIAIAVLVTRLVAMNSGSIQTAANALVGVIISSAVSAAFAWWLARRLDVLLAGAQHDEGPAQRWVMVAR